MTVYTAHLGGLNIFLDILVGYEIKIESWGDWMCYEGYGYFWSDFLYKIRHQIVSPMSCGRVISYVYVSLCYVFLQVNKIRSIFQMDLKV